MFTLIVTGDDKDTVVENLQHIYDQIKKGRVWGQLGTTGAWELEESTNVDVA